MNYRHAYHAGNFADVLKHWLLWLMLDRFLKKETPFFTLDTHAGIGLYDLADRVGPAFNFLRDLLARGPAAQASIATF